MSKLPFEILDAMIQCFGRSFHFKDTMETFLRSAGVEKSLVTKYRDEYKFVWARKVLSELCETEEGQLILRKILTELCKLRDLADKEVPERSAGISALRTLKELAIKHDLIAKEEKKKENERKSVFIDKTKIIEERSKKLEELSTKFKDAVRDANRQSAGYTLEDILNDLFAIFEIQYRKSYKTQTQQIDGHFRLEGFDYLVEARWRKDVPSEEEIAGFKQKVDTKLESTRGIFFSINGFRPEIIDQFSGRGQNIIFFTGEDLIIIIEGRIDLRDALRIKIEKAAQEGIVYFPLKIIN